MKKIIKDIVKTLFVFIIVFFASSYAHLLYYVYSNNEMNGAYNQYTTLYFCELNLLEHDKCIYHEQGHKYDYYNLPMSFLWKDQRSKSVEFRANVDAIYMCTSYIFAFNNIHSNEYPKTSSSLMSIEYEMKNNKNEHSMYEEIYAKIYSYMKIHRWDIYHYEDVEEMVAYQLINCQDYLERNSG